MYKDTNVKVTCRCCCEKTECHCDTKKLMLHTECPSDTQKILLHIRCQSDGLKKLLHTYCHRIIECHNDTLKLLYTQNVSDTEFNVTHQMS